MGIDLDKFNITETIRPSHESNELSTKGGIIGWIRSAIVGSIRYKVISLSVLLILGYAGVESGVASRVGERIAVWDFLGAKELADEELSKKETKSELLNIHPVFKNEASSFAEYFEDFSGKILGKVTKFKVIRKEEFLIGKTRFKSMAYAKATKVCNEKFAYDFHPASIKNIKAGNAYKKAWAGKKKFSCVFPIKNL